MQQLQGVAKRFSDSHLKGADEVPTAEFYLARAERRLVDWNKSSGAAARLTGTLSTEPSGALGVKGNLTTKNLRYDGADFDYWRNALHDELSVERRIEALRALGAFAAHGYGETAMQATIDAMSDTSIWDFIGGPESTLRETALGIVKRIPRPMVLGVVTKALKTGNANQRLFAVAIVSQATAQPQDAVPLLVEATRDEDQHVRMTARRFLAFVDRRAPETITALRAALSDEDLDEVSDAIRIVAGGNPYGLNAELYRIRRTAAHCRTRSRPGPAARARERARASCGDVSTRPLRQRNP